MKKPLILILAIAAIDKDSNYKPLEDVVVTSVTITEPTA